MLPEVPEEAKCALPADEEKWRRFVLAVAQHEQCAAEEMALNAAIQRMTRKPLETDSAYADRIQERRDLYPLASWVDKANDGGDIRARPGFTDTRKRSVEFINLVGGFTKRRAQALVDEQYKRGAAGTARIELFDELITWVRAQDAGSRKPTGLSVEPRLHAARKE